MSRSRKIVLDEKRPERGDGKQFKGYQLNAVHLRYFASGTVFVSWNITGNLLNL